jgi:hypothetical protein
MTSRTGPEGVGADRSEIDELRDIIRANRSDIDELQAQASAAEERAAVDDVRETDQARRLDDLEARLDVDGALIAELRTEGVVAQNQIVQLEEALRTSRTIGTALGIIMADRQVDQQEAFALLSKHSQDTNRKLRVLAEEVVRHGDSGVVLGG